MSGVGNMPPDWAIQKACDLLGLDTRTVGERDRLTRGSGYVHAFARYIAEHEEAPVDPLLDEVQSIADEQGLNLSAMPRVETALYLALRRGMELAQSGDSK